MISLDDERAYLRYLRLHYRISIMFLALTSLTIINMLLILIQLLDNYTNIFSWYGLFVVLSATCCTYMSREAFLRLRYPQTNQITSLVRIYALADVIRIALNQSQQASNTIELLLLILLVMCNTLLHYLQCKLVDVVAQLCRREEYSCD